MLTPPPDRMEEVIGLQAAAAAENSATETNGVDGPRGKSRAWKMKSGKESIRVKQKLDWGSADLKAILIDLRSECAAAALRQEEWFAQLFDEQRMCQEGLQAMQQGQEELMSEVRSISKSFATTEMSTAHTTHTTHTTHNLVRLKTAATGIENEACKKARQKISLVASGSSAQVDQPTTERSYTPSSAVILGSREELADSDNTMCAYANRLLRRKEFELAIAAAIMCNAFVMAWETQYNGLEVGFSLKYPGRPKQARDVWVGAQTAFSFFDWLFGIVFCLEFLVKLACFRMAYFRVYWNILDSACVVAFLFDKVASADAEFINPHMIRLLRLFRLFRLVRLIRFLETLESLYVMTTAIAGMSRVLGWAVTLLTLMLLACDLFLVQVLHATYFADVDLSTLSDDQLKKHQEMYEYFGTCSRCMLSMFEITLGNWPPVARLLSEEVSEWFSLVCVVHKVSIGFAVIGVINGVILQETFKVAQTDDIIMLRQKRKSANILRSKLSTLFDSLDSDGDGIVNSEEFHAICEDSNMKTWLGSLDIETDDLDMLFHLCDVNGNGCLTLEEIIDRMPRIKGTARSIDVLALQEKLKARTFK